MFINKRLLTVFLLVHLFWLTIPVSMASDSVEVLESNWQVTMQPFDTEASAWVITVSNDIERLNVNVYLVWVDLDAWQFSSWLFEQGWHPELKPIFDTAIDLPAFDSYPIKFEDKLCPENHRCFLAFIATSPDVPNPTQPDFWQAASLLPLSLSASQARLPGQTFFLPLGDDAVYHYDTVPVFYEGGSTTAGDGMTSAQTGIPDVGSAETEKPDIFKLIGDKVLYANESAQRFQVIDISNLSTPRLIDWLALSGNPQEIYVLHPYYVLLQTNDMDEDSTQLTVLQNQDGVLKTIHNMALSGKFIESRRRNNVIYIVMQDFISKDEMANLVCEQCITQNHILNVKALRLTTMGQLEEIAKAQVSGYSPIVAIFPNELVIANHNPEEHHELTTQIQVFDLSKENPLVSLPSLEVPGRIPSEFHLDVHNQQLRVVYGPKNRKAGSTLAIYQLPNMTLIGQINQIAPGEDLFATRFVDNRAFIVTFKRKDPLWVIDLSDPTAPQIFGKLEVPGWSEKMFFHKNRLFAVGIHNQPSDEFSWTSQVALSLFDVKEPTKPSLIKRFIPLASQTNWSSSLALSDERALLLDWEEAFAALPVETKKTTIGNHLQIVSLANDTIEDAGYLDSPVPIQRSVSVAADVLAALSDQALLTLRWGSNKKPQVLGELELAINLVWLEQRNSYLWAGVWGNHGYHRFYRYSTDNLETPVEHWNLQVGYGGLEMGDNLAVFYDIDFYNTSIPYLQSLSKVRVLDVNTGQLYPKQFLFEKKLEHDVVIERRRKPLVHDGWFHLEEERFFRQHADVRTALFQLPEEVRWLRQEVLRSWNLKENAQEAIVRSSPIRSIPGIPVGITANGELITREDWGRRLNVLALGPSHANLLDSRKWSCQGALLLTWADGVVYIACRMNDKFWPGDTIIENSTLEDKTNNKVNEAEPTTQLLRVEVIEQKLTETGHWTLTGPIFPLRAASKDIVLVSVGGSYSCNLYQLIPEQKPVLLKKFETCSYDIDRELVLTPTQAWIAKGLAGIKAINW